MLLPASKHISLLVFIQILRVSLLKIYMYYDLHWGGILM